VELGGVDVLHAPFPYRKAHTLPCPVLRGRKSGYAPVGMTLLFEYHSDNQLNCHPRQLSCALRPTRGDETCEPSLPGFVLGHDFSRAVKAHSREGFSPCQGSRQELKPRIIWLEVARLKSCPDNKAGCPGSATQSSLWQDVFRPEVSVVDAPAVATFNGSRKFVPLLLPTSIAANLR